MQRSAIIEIHKEELKFSAGHFMLLSATQRETMHGHDYQVHATFNALIKQNGMAFDCRDYKERLLKICQSLDYRFILPSQSEYLTIVEEAEHWVVRFGTQKIPFLKQDAVVLPVCNVTLEELSNWFLQQVITNNKELQETGIQGIMIKIFNGRGESGATNWGKLA